MNPQATDWCHIDQTSSSPQLLGPIWGLGMAWARENGVAHCLHPSALAGKHSSSLFGFHQQQRSPQGAHETVSQAEGLSCPYSF